jgi:hypothetical protein
VTPPLSSNELAAIAVFPLPRVVWFPATQLPLHVFEARYRRMVVDCLERDHSVMAVAQLRPGWQGDYEGRPAIHTVAGAGRIVHHRRNPDGTYDIELAGISRVRLHELDAEGLPYRRARAEALPDRLPDAGVTRADLGALWSLATQVAQEVHRVDAKFALRAVPGDDASTLCDRIADQFVTDPDARQELLETQNVARRIELLRATLARLHLALLATDGSQPRTLH